MIDVEWIITAGNRRTGSTVHYHLVREVIENEGLGQGFGAIPGGALDPDPEWRILDFGDKAEVKVFRTHGMTNELARLMAATPTKMFYIYRDMRDALVSVKKRENRDFDYFKNGNWIQNRIKIDSLWTNHPDVMTTRYETMLLDMYTEVLRIYKHLGLEPDNEFAGYLEEKYSLDNVKNTSIFYEEVPYGAVGDEGRRPFLRNHIQSGKWGRWLEELTEEQKIWLDEEHGQYIQYKGYPLYKDLKQKENSGV